MSTPLPLQNKISQSSQAERAYSIIKAQYGNGYQDRARDGINNIKETWTVNYENITLADYTTVITALDASYGVSSFSWQPVGDPTSKNYILTKVTRTIQSGNIYSVSIVLEQVFDLS